MLEPVNSSTRITVIGTNYVGLITAAGFAELGYLVIGVDVDPIKIDRLQHGQLPIHEPDLDGVVQRWSAAGRLRFTVDYAEALGDAQIAFICVGTPASTSGAADMSQVEAVTGGLARHTPPGASLIVVTKSTVPVGTGDWIEATLHEAAQRSGARFSVVSNPEFLREGSALADFRQPHRVVVGGREQTAVERVAELYARLPLQPPIVTTDLRTAEMIKYASNAFLATRISFINEMALICEQVGADVDDLAVGMGLDRRIGPAFLDAGIGYGGSCFPKDVLALQHVALEAGVEPRLLKAVTAVNADMRHVVPDKLEAELGNLQGRRIAVLGLAFKACTDDVRESPALEVICTLRCAFDPFAMDSARKVLPDLPLGPDAYAVMRDADALVLLTEWPEFAELDLVRVRRLLRRPLVVDGRNMFDPRGMAARGFTYRAVGRSAQEPLALDGGTLFDPAVQLQAA